MPSPDDTTPSQMPVPDELADVRAKIKWLQEREATLRGLLMDNPDLRTGAAWVAEIKTTAQMRTDLKELRACYPDAVAEHTFPTSITRIVLSAITEDGEIVHPRKLSA